MNVELIESPSSHDWISVKERALVTMGKTKVINAPSLEWKRKILNARHSPIRYLRYSFFISDLPYWVSNELCRHHVGVEKYVKSQRNDRQNEYDRASARQDAPVNVIVDFNAESLMVFCNKRLCSKATKEMRELASKIRDEVYKNNPEMHGFLVPMCSYLGGKCREMESCRIDNLL